MADDIISHAKKSIISVSGKTDRVILFFSCGKDSLCLLDLMAPYFKEIVLVYMYFVKDLEHINKYLNYALNKYPNTTLKQIPHWNLTYILKSGLYCIENKNITLKKLSDIDSAVKCELNIEYSFYGMKQSDSLNRRLTLKQYENEITSKTGKIYPLSKWSNKEVDSYIKLHRIITPIKYTANKKSQGLGFNEDVFLFLKNNYPEDLNKIFSVFPLSRQIIYNYEYKAIGNSSNSKE